MGYIDPDLITDEGAAAEANLAAIADQIPGATFSEGHPVTVIAEAFGITAATIAARIVAEAKDAYADGFGRNVLKLPRIVATPATTSVTIVPNDGLAHDLDAGFEVVLVTPSGEDVTFATTASAHILGTGSVVDIEALDPGADANDAFGVGGVAVDHDDLAWIGSVTATAPAVNGTDEEDTDSYVQRIQPRAQRVHGIPVTPEDYAEFGLDVPSVARTLAVNRLDPANPATPTNGHVTIYAADITGAAPTPMLTALAAYYAAIEVVLGTTVHVLARGTVDVTVTLAITAAAGYLAATVKATAEAAITTALSRAVYAYDADAPTRWTPSNGAQLTIYDVSALVDDLPGVAKITDVKINGAYAPVAVPATSLLSATSVTATAT